MTSPGPSADRPAPVSANPAPRVLIVDDETDTLLLLSRRLEAEGFFVLTATDGLEALNLARREKPALIVLDLMLPKMDGYKICSFLKHDVRFSSIPIVILTARAHGDDARKAREVSADQFFTKPCDLKELVAIVKRLLPARSSPLA